MPIAAEDCLEMRRFLPSGMPVAKRASNGRNDMKCAEPTMVIERQAKTAKTQEQTSKGIISFPAGIMGFETAKQFVLLSSPEEAPFLWLQMAEEPKLAFLVISPWLVLETYQPDVGQEDVAFLGLQSSKDAWVFNIVTVHKDGTATVNLKGPIIVNRHTLIGKQVIPLNSPDYSLQHPVPVAK